MSWEMHAELGTPQGCGRAIREWCPALGTSVQSWTTLSKVTHLTVKMRNRASFYRLSQESPREPPFHFLFIYPLAWFRLASRARGMVFLKSSYEKQLFSIKICSIVSKFSSFFILSLFLSPPARRLHIPNFPGEAVPSFPQSLTQTGQPTPSASCRQPSPPSHSTITLFFWSPN